MREWIERRQQLMSWVQKKGKGEVKTEWDEGNYIFYIQGLFQVTPYLWSYLLKMNKWDIFIAVLHCMILLHGLVANSDTFKKPIWCLNVLNFSFYLKYYPKHSNNSLCVLYLAKKNLGKYLLWM